MEVEYGAKTQDLSALIVVLWLAFVQTQAAGWKAAVLEILPVGVKAS